MNLGLLQRKKEVQYSFGFETKWFYDKKSNHVRNLIKS